MTPKEAYEIYTNDIGTNGQMFMPWSDLPPLARSAWAKVVEAANGPAVMEANERLIAKVQSLEDQVKNLESDNEELRRQKAQRQRRQVSEDGQDRLDQHTAEINSLRGRISAMELDRDALCSSIRMWQDSYYREKAARESAEKKAEELQADLDHVSSVAHLERELKVERCLRNDMQSDLDTAAARISGLRSSLENVAAERDRAREDASDYKNRSEALLELLANAGATLRGLVSGVETGLARIKP